MRLAPERTGGRSATPIYDRLYAEYRMAFRTLPGDRSGEEHLGFTAFDAFTGFATGLHATGHCHHAGYPMLKHDARQLPGAAGVGHVPQPAAGGPHGGHGHPAHAAPPGSSHHVDRSGRYQSGTWRPTGRQHGPEDLLPAILPSRPGGER